MSYHARIRTPPLIVTARTGLQETREALKALRSNPLDDLGLRLALEALITTTAGAANLKLDLRLPPADPVLSPDTEHTIYRIAQEAVANVVRHAMAGALAVHLAAEEHRLTLVVRDDGRGFDTAQDSPGGHYGLAGMRERAELMGGQFTIASAPGAGTIVTVTLIL